MFNFKKFAAEIDFSQKIKPEQIPGSTIDQKVQWISNWFAEKGMSLTIQDAYRMLGHRPIEESGLENIEKYRTNIQKLREFAGNILKSEALKSRPDLEERINSGDKAASKELDRVIYTLVSSKLGPIIENIVKVSNQVFIPEFVKLYSSSTRTQLDIGNLPSYKSPEELATIRKWIAEESMRIKNEFRTEFLTIFEKYAKRYPNLTIENMFFIIKQTANVSQKDQSIDIPDDVVKDIKKELFELNKKIGGLDNSGNIFGRVLSLHPDAFDVERWKQIIGDDLKSSWTLISVLKTFYPELQFEAVAVRVKDEQTGKVEKRDSDYLFFFPLKKPDGSDWSSPEEKRLYAAKQLGYCIESGGYDNETLFDVLKIPEAKDKKEDDTEKESTETEEKPKKFVRDRWASLIYYYYIKLCRPKSNTTGLSVAGTQLGIFRQDLRLAGLDHLADMLSAAYEKKPDTRYAAFDLKFLSNAEKNIIEKLRSEYYLDAVPFPVKIPCPQDNPTTVERFEIDFLLPCDILKGFTRSMERKVDETTGEILTRYEIVPNIEYQIMFVGEFFGIRMTQEYDVKDSGRPWVKPDGSPPLFASKSQPGRYYEVSPKISPYNFPPQYRHYYQLKSEWKVFTFEVIADMMGTRTLTLKDADLETPKNLMAKLDAKRIVYISPNCTPNVGCEMTKQIEARIGQNEVTRQYLDELTVKQRFDDEQLKLLRIVDCAIINAKLSTALKQARDTYVDPNQSDNFLGIGFNRQTMNEHMEVMQDLRYRIDELQKMHLDDLENEDIYRDLIATKSVLKNMYTSPLYDFKMKFEEILSKGKIAENILKLTELKDKVKNNEIKSLSELRKAIYIIDSELINEKSEDEAL